VSEWRIFCIGAVVGNVVAGAIEITAMVHHWREAGDTNTFALMTMFLFGTLAVAAFGKRTPLEPPK
jgi:hypothetical protein